ncbi:MAG: HAD-IIIA family hydrolase [Planctomycetes bacterium]|nr:HAD-IIIA family hydrolase [Planctomycetota bacterium]
MRPISTPLDSIRPALPGTEPPTRGLFVDRWGTLLELPGKGFEAQFENAEFVPGAVDALFRAHQAGWRIYLLGNEDAVARGRLKVETWEAFETALLAHLAGMGVPVARCYACIDHPEHGKGKRQRDSVFLLPNTGAMYHAMQHDGVRLSESWVIGDSTLELAAGWRAGCRTAAVRTGLAGADGELAIDPSLTGDDLPGVLNEILMRLATRT